MSVIERNLSHSPQFPSPPSPGVSAGLQLAEELAGAPVDGDDPLRVEDLPDVCELLRPAGPLTAVTPLTLAGAGVGLVLLAMMMIRSDKLPQHR